MRYLIMCMLCLFSYFCTAQNNAFDSMTPESLKIALDKCQSKPESTANCEHLKQMAAEMSRLAYKLRIDPLGYGQNIIQLQSSVVQNTELMKTNSYSESAAVLAEQRQSLAEYLQIISWLASPG